MPKKSLDRYKAKHLWYFGEAQMLVRELQEVLWPLRWHVAMGGGVLNHGYSNDDLDLYILPSNKDAKTLDIYPALNDVLKWEKEIRAHNSAYMSMAPAIESADIYTYNGKRVDIFVFKPHCDVCNVAERLLGE